MKVSASFRDPSGFLFHSQGKLYRQVNYSYQADYEKLMTSGLYEQLTRSGAMIDHQEADPSLAFDPGQAYKVIQPRPIGFVSYPYEWCFGELKEAALLTLAIARRSLEFGMSLKDASAYNVQFENGRAIFIDTLSFETYQEGQPWVAYRQFCQHFLAPLALMAAKDIRLNQLVKVFLDGIPLDMASVLLPVRSRLSPGLMTHIHLHARSQQHYADKTIQKGELKPNVSRMATLGLLENLTGTVKRLKLKSVQTEWADYYQDNNYSEEAFAAKKEIIAKFIDRIKPGTVWDLGANTGEFSRLASALGIQTIAFDIDPGAVQQNYLRMKANKEKHLLPLIMDLTNPSPGIGWQLQERQSLLERGTADTVFALALIHHLAIANNVPLPDVADFLAKLGRYLVIEFVPKTDSQVGRLLANRVDIFPAYTQAGFEEAFKSNFKFLEVQVIPDSERVLYLMENKS